MADWSGVFPAATTHMTQDGQLDLDSTAHHLEKLIQAGMHGLVMLGSLGEGNSLSFAEKEEVLKMTVATSGGRVPVVSGVSALSTQEAVEIARMAKRAGVDGLMVLPSIGHKADSGELVAHFRTVAQAAQLPVILYNNPIAYGTDLQIDALVELADEDLFIGIKESGGNTRRITDIFVELGNRYEVFAGIDDLALECFALGARGWIAGIALAFPEENQHLWDLMLANRWDEARALYQWYTPLLHLDVGPKFVQKIKLATHEVGLGSEWVRLPRLPLTGAEREETLKIIHESLEKRPVIERLNQSPVGTNA